MAKTPENKDTAEWTGAFKKLAPDRQKALAAWFAMQKLTFQNLGLKEDEWWGYIEWALKNPLDYGFVEDFPGEALPELRGLLANQKALQAIGEEGGTGPAIPTGEFQPTQEQKDFKRLIQSRAGRKA